MKHLLPLLTTVVLGVSTTTATAQRFGIWVHNGTSTYSGVLCGFSCSARAITVPMRTPGGAVSRLGVNVSGRKNQLAVLVISPGKAKDCKTGIPIPGSKGTLLAAFPTVIAATATLSKNYRGTTCGAGFEMSPSPNSLRT